MSKNNFYATTIRGGAIRFALVRSYSSLSEKKKFVTKMEKWGHPCPMDTLISSFCYQSIPLEC